MSGPTYVVQSNPRKTPITTVHDPELETDDVANFFGAIANPNMVYAVHPNDELQEGN